MIIIIIKTTTTTTVIYGHETRERDVDVHQGMILSHGVKDTLSLSWNPSRDSVLIKILMWRHVKHIPPFMSQSCLLNR